MLFLRHLPYFLLSYSTSSSSALVFLYIIIVRIIVYYKKYLVPQTPAGRGCDVTPGCTRQESAPDVPHRGSSAPVSAPAGENIDE